MPSSHLRKVFNPEQVRKIATETERLRIAQGAEIVCVRGLSGTLVASAMSVLFGTPFAVARKPDEKSHGSALELVDYDDDHIDLREYQNWIIVDDLIASGHTVRQIRETVETRGDNNILGRCKGIVLYHWDYDNSTFHFESGYAVPIFYIGEEQKKSMFVDPAPFTALPEATNFEKFRDYASIARSSLFRSPNVLSVDWVGVDVGPDV